MRLSELDASFIAKIRDGWRKVESLDEAQGLSFQCPACAVGKPRRAGHVEGAHYVLCWFRNPRRLPPVGPEVEPGPGRWWAEGTGLDDLTFGHGEPQMAKSVQLSGGCNWHGFVTNGDAA